MPKLKNCKTPEKMKGTRTARSWTADKVSMLRSLWEEGLSTTKIAERIGGGCTKNAVISKANYLNLKPRSRKQVYQASGLVKPRFGQVFGAPGPKRLYEKYKPVAHLPLPGLTPKELIDLGPNECRWPFGHLPDMKFCGGRTQSGQTYCMHHEKISRPKFLREPKVPNENLPEEIEEAVDEREVV